MQLPVPAEAHLWYARLDAGAVRSAELEEWLSSPERARARSFLHETDRRHFAFARGVLREVLGAYTGGSPGAVELSYGPHGKPQLADPALGPCLRFNLAHAGPAVLIGVAREREIGVDLESIRRDIRIEDVARAHFSRSEQRAILGLSAGERRDAFYRCWTRKEAVLKCMGTGFGTPLADFDVSVRAGEAARILENRIRGQEGSTWTLWDVELPPGLCGAVAMSGRGGGISLLPWPEGREGPRKPSGSCRSGTESAE